MNLLVKKLESDAILPQIATSNSAGYDLYVRSDCELLPGSVHSFNLGIAVEIPTGFCGLLLPRSSWGKKGIVLENTIGVIDSDYRGPIIAVARNNSSSVLSIKRNDRLFQLLIVPVFNGPVIEVEELSETERGQGGFGSTGK